MDVTHAWDQVDAMLRDLAPVICAYHMRLVENGMSRDEALQVAIAWQSDMILRAGGGTG